MRSNFIEFHQDGESIFINKNMIVAIYIDEDFHDTAIECLGDHTYNVDENINEVIRCLE